MGSPSCLTLASFSGPASLQGSAWCCSGSLAPKAGSVCIFPGREEQRAQAVLCGSSAVDSAGAPLGWDAGGWGLQDALDPGAPLV